MKKTSAFALMLLISTISYIQASEANFILNHQDGDYYHVTLEGKKFVIAGDESSGISCLGSIVYGGAVGPEEAGLCTMVVLNHYFSNKGKTLHIDFDGNYDSFYRKRGEYLLFAWINHYQKREHVIGISSNKINDSIAALRAFYHYHKIATKTVDTEL